MQLPVRCYSCNRSIGHLNAAYSYHRADASCSRKEALDRLGLSMLCCRRMVLSHVNLSEDLKLFSRNRMVIDEAGTVYDAFVSMPRTVTCD